MARLIERAAEPAWSEIAPLIELGLHHEQQHQELILMDIKHVFSLNPLLPAYRRRSCSCSRRRAPLAWVEFAGGLEEIGHAARLRLRQRGAAAQVWLEPFRLAARPVTCGEYLGFIDDGGYARPEFWLSDGWATVREQGWEAPLYWRRDDERVVDLHPVRRAAGSIRPSRSAMSASTRPTPSPDGPASGCRPKPNGRSRPRIVPVSRQFRRSRPSPSLRRRPRRTAEARAAAADVSATSGNGPRAPTSPIRAFAPPAGAIGEYNGKFMCNQMVLRGGAAVTPAGHIRATYRNFFPPVGALGVRRAAAGGGSLMKDGARFAFHDLAPGEESFRDAVLAGLAPRPQAIPCKFFYDARGSALFEEICGLPEYYPTRTEIAILEENAAEIAAQMGPHCRLIEFGSGASQKVRILLQALDRPAAYVPVDISREHLRDAAAGSGRGLSVGAGRSRSAPTTRGPFPLPPLPGAGASGSGSSPARRSAISSPTRRSRSSPITRASSAPAARC